MKNNIRIIRKEKGLSLTDLSNMTSISLGYLCHLEKR